MSGDGGWSCVREVLGEDLLSVVLPVYRLGDTIEANLDVVASCLDEGDFRYELVPVDDGSGDGTADALRRATAKRPDVVRPVWVEKNAGKGNALKVGFRASRGAYVLLLDGDLDIAPKMLPKFFESMRANGSDVVVGSKRHPESNVQYPWHRRLASVIYFGLVRLFIGLPITDTQTGMKLFKRRLLGESLDRMLVKTYAFDLELLSIAYGRGAKISEAPVEIRFGGKFGALKPRTVRDMVMDTLAVFYRLRLLHYYAKVEVPPPLEKPPLVSVVIACPGGSWMLDECLSALETQTYRNFEVIVLPDDEMKGERGKVKDDVKGERGKVKDEVKGERRKVKGDALGDEDSPFTLHHSPFTTLHPSPFTFHLSILPTGKVRPAEKRNIGIAAAKGDIVAFIDDDAYPDSRWLENAVKYFSEPSIGGVGGPGVTPPGDGFLAKAGGRVYANLFVSGNYRYRYVGGRVRLDVDDYPSCNLLVRTDLLRKIGGYRTDFWPGEDTLLCEAIVLGEHKRIVYDPWSIVYHHRRRLFGPHLRQLGRYGFHRGYFVKRFPATSCRPGYFVPSLFVLGVLLGGAVFALPEHPATTVLCWTYIGVTGFYALVTLLSSFSVNPFMWLFTWLGVVTSHLWYGIRFLQGLCASRAPCEYIGRDHARR